MRGCRQAARWGWRSWRGLPLILPMMPNAVRWIVDSAMQAAGLAPQVVMETDLAPIGRLVAKGLGWSVLPSSAAGNAALVDASMPHWPIRGLTITWLLATAGERAMSRAASEWCRLLCADLAGLIQSGSIHGRYLGP